MDRPRPTGWHRRSGNRALGVAKSAVSREQSDIGLVPWHHALSDRRRSLSTFVIERIEPAGSRTFAFDDVQPLNLGQLCRVCLLVYFLLLL